MRSDAPELSPDFADRVVRQVAQVRRRRRTLAGLAVAAVAGVALWVGTARHAPAVAPALVASDFEWLEDVGTGTSTPASLLFPDERSPDENLLVVVAEQH